jgi:hypothetical protein
VRRGLLLASIAIILVGAGCGGSTSSSPPSHERPEQLDPGGTLVAFLDAASARDETATRSLLTSASQSSLDLPRLSAAAAQVVGGRVVISQLVDGPWAIAAVAKGTHAYAAPLRRVNGQWRVDLGRTISLRPILPYPGRLSPTADPQIAAEARAGNDVRLALWLDGADFAVEAGGPRPGFITAFGRVGSDLSPGRHVVVAFARSGRRAAATAWTFRVGEPVG